MKKDYIHIQRSILNRVFEVHWFSEYGDWFIYFRCKTPIINRMEVSEIRFSSVGFMKSRYIIK